MRRVEEEEEEEEGLVTQFPGDRGLETGVRGAAVRYLYCRCLNTLHLVTNAPSRKSPPNFLTQQDTVSDRSNRSHTDRLTLFCFRSL